MARLRAQGRLRKVLRMLEFGKPIDVTDSLPDILPHAWWIPALLLSLLGTAAAAASFEGKVVGVIDGDTVEVLDAERTAHRVRRSGIDTPERGQPFGTRAKERLIELAAGKVVRASPISGIATSGSSASSSSTGRT